MPTKTEQVLDDAWNSLEAAPGKARAVGMATIKAAATPELVLDARILVGTTYVVEGDNTAGLRQLLGVLPDLHRKPDLARAYNAIGMAYGHLGNIEETLHFHQLSLELRRESGNAKATALALCNLAIHFSELGDDATALIYYDEASQLSVSVGDELGEGTALINASHSQIELGEFASALAGIERALSLLDEASYKNRVAFAYQQLCTAARLAGDHKRAEAAGLRALELAGDLPGVRWPCLMAMGRLFLDRDWSGNDPTKGLRMLEEALEQTKILDSQPSLAEMHGILAVALEEEGDHRQALVHQKAMHELQTSIHKQNGAGQLAAMRVKLEVEALHRNAAEQEALNIELARVNRAKSEFLKVASHDLKNALTAIVFTSDFICNDAQAPSAHAPAAIIQKQTQRMLHLIENLLDADAIESGQRALMHEDFDLSMLAREVAKSLGASAESKDIRLEVRAQGRCRVFADQTATGQILENLLSNAVKFSPRWGAVTIVITDRVLCVQDEGPGFTPQDHALMFQRFARLSAQPTGDEPSTGLGLSIVHSLVVAMDGEISAKNGPHGGAHMTISLPEPRQR